MADLHLPAGEGIVPVAVVIHGGFWMSNYGMELATPLAKDLAAHGIAGYAIEYRRVGNGGGWPATFEDVAAAIDALLIGGVRENLGGQAVPSLMGATPAEDPARYELASPYERLPLKAPVALVHGDRDHIVPLGQSRRFRDAATRAGAPVTLTELPALGHFELIDPAHDAWRVCREEIERLQRS